MSVYLTRVEHINDYWNVRPMLEWFDDNAAGSFEYVDSLKFGSYGTITIGGASYMNFPFLEDKKYLMFTLADEDLANLEKRGLDSYKIKASDFNARSKTLDSYRIKEVIKLDYGRYDFNLFYKWQNEPIYDIMKPITASVYLYNGRQIMGPFSYENVSESAYRFFPESTNEKPYFINIYEGDLESLIYEIKEGNREYGEYSLKERHIIVANKLNDLQGEVRQVDFIDDKNLKELAGKYLKMESKQALKDAKNALMELSNFELTDERKERLLKMFEAGEMTESVISAMSSTILSNDDSMEKVAGIILNNNNYMDKIYPIIRKNEGFDSIYKKLENEKNSVYSSSINEDEINRIYDENKKLKEELGKYENSPEEVKSLKEKLRTYENSPEEIKNLRKEKEKLEIINDNLRSNVKSFEEDIQKKIRNAYIDIAFDGALSSMMLREAAKYEESEKTKDICFNVLEKNKCDDKSDILEPKELVKFLYDKLKNKREIEFNDVANILLCLSQSFLSILVGEPGSGKTSLVSLIANILGMSNPRHNRYAEIAVEKGWTSRRDFIGYYNPLTKSLDAANGDMLKVLEVMKAESEKEIADFPYFVLLDEANLSQMEHYWADFMSLCDFDKKRRTVSLGENYVYPISETLRFIATINLDHTTELLSPRLIDRAWIILVEAADIPIEEAEEQRNLEEYPIVGFECLKKLCSQNDKLDSYIVEKFNKIANCFQSVGVKFSPRIINMIKKYCLAGKMVMNFEDNGYVALDYAVAQKILPMINGYGEYHTFLQELLKECDQNTMPRCYKIIEKIIKKGDANMQYYQFFAR